jgi:hypothetical protein
LVQCELLTKNIDRMTFNEESLRKGIQFGLGSKGIWTPELEDEMFKEIKNQALSQVAVSEWHLFSDELPKDNEEILIRNGTAKEVRISKWKYSIYLNDLKKGMEWKRWVDACR